MKKLNPFYKILKRAYRLGHILTADGMPVIVGFVAAESLILTCAYVITQSGHTKPTRFDLPLLTTRESFAGRVSFLKTEAL